MELSRDEEIILLKFKRAKRYAQDNKQAEINICILPGGRVFITKDIFQDRIETEETLESKK
ncbi:MAG: hypothetical protein Q8N62_03425 [Candidatus Omnitrophota bacterium]|nr:hypothetical protein [Candidatus Omnitrophota bacterium]